MTKYRPGPARRRCAAWFMQISDKTMNYRILIVDDEADILEFIRYNLKKEGYDVYTASDG